MVHETRSGETRRVWVLGGGSFKPTTQQRVNTYPHPAWLASPVRQPIPGSSLEKVCSGNFSSPGPAPMPEWSDGCRSPAGRPVLPVFVETSPGCPSLVLPTAARTNGGGASTNTPAGGDLPTLSGILISGRPLAPAWPPVRLPLALHWAPLRCPGVPLPRRRLQVPSIRPGSHPPRPRSKSYLDALTSACLPGSVAVVSGAATVFRAWRYYTPDFNQTIYPETWATAISP